MSTKKLLSCSFAALAALGLNACSDIDSTTSAQTETLSGPQSKKPDPKPEMPPLVPGKNYPTAKLSKTPKVVVSPYKPYNLVGVKDYQSGEKARDPYTKEIFLVP